MRLSQWAGSMAAKRTILIRACISHLNNTGRRVIEEDAFLTPLVSLFVAVYKHDVLVTQHSCAYPRQPYEAERRSRISDTTV